METTQDLAKILRRVQQFINVAEGSNNNVPDSPEWHALNVEQASARAMADALMLEYAITEADAEAAKPASERMKPTSELFEGGSGDLEHHIDALASDIARFTRCKVRIAHWDYERHFYMYRVYGYESDVRYFQFLYTTLRLHFIGALRPKIDPSKTQDENSYILHNAGFGWHEIAEMYGWKPERDFEGKETGVWFTKEGELWDKDLRTMVRPYRSGWLRECKRRGETPVMNISPENFRKDAANGYRDRIRRRLREVEEGRRLEGGSALALRIEDLEEFIREQNASRYTRCPACSKLSMFDYKCDMCGNTDGMADPPEPYEECARCKAAKSGTCRAHHIGGGRMRYRKFSAAGYAAGERQANSADLGGQRTGSSTTKSIS
jgi:hypothetical protein